MKAAIFCTLLSIVLYFLLRPPDLSYLLQHEYYPVRIIRDTWGVAHIYADTNAAAAFGLGFAQASDNFYGLQMVFLASRGMCDILYMAL